MNAYGNLNPNVPDVHNKREVQKKANQMKKLARKKSNENTGNGTLISSHSDHLAESDDKAQEEDFSKLLRKYLLSRCKAEFAKNGIRSGDDLKYMNRDELDKIEPNLPKLKRKQFIKLIRAVSEVCKDYKKNKDDGRQLSSNPNANNHYTFYNNNNTNNINGYHSNNNNNNNNNHHNIHMGEGTKWQYNSGGESIQSTYGENGVNSRMTFTQSSTAHAMNNQRYTPALSSDMNPSIERSSMEARDFILN